MPALGPTLFYKYLNPSKIFQTVFLFPRVLPLVRFSVISDHNGGVRTKKPTKKGSFVDAESYAKFGKFFNLKLTNAILMKLTTIMYLHESVDPKALRARNSFFLAYFNWITSEAFV